MQNKSEKVKGVVIVLGSPNDEKGNLFDIGIGRNNKGIEEYKNHPGYKILVTGGFGDHFNRTKKPHAFYAKQFLLKRGIPEKDILEFAESHDTVDDALKSKPIVDRYKIKNLVIVTSDFHIERVKFIFEKVFEGYNLRFLEAKTNFTKERYEILNAHEKKELEKLT